MARLFSLAVGRGATLKSRPRHHLPYIWKTRQAGDQRRKSPAFSPSIIGHFTGSFPYFQPATNAARRRRSRHQLSVILPALFLISSRPHDAQRPPNFILQSRWDSENFSSSIFTHVFLILSRPAVGT
ncbi:hypothetical protein OUZ56_033929 [Daphnia magna]|uniref:Uncharacterized protein n=1 Tax=Daphnia magna TaxID=35525 RepID=A0ABR0BBA5_9CRUS|nr:hypothetical protein OUZ56_033929 [Daphnia magna]